jgi:prepilin-type N-terminal cleavage/methylation domain-containing protein
MRLDILAGDFRILNGIEYAFKGYGHSSTHAARHFNCSYRLREEVALNYGVHSRRGITLIEVMIAIAVFVTAAVSFNAGYFMLNMRSTRLRLDAAAFSIMRAKIAKDMTDPWITGSTPVDCVITSGTVATTADPNDPYDAGPAVTLLSSADNPAVPAVAGTLYRSTYTFESASQTVVIDYRMTYVYRNQTYNDYASTVRARDY